MLIAALLGLAVDGILRHQLAEESQAIAIENRELRTLATTIETQLPKARATVERAEMTFAQVWAKSGLGSQAALPGMGPFDSRQARKGETALTSLGINLDLYEVPVELDRLVVDGPTTQDELTALLEYFHDAERLLSNTPSIRPAPISWETSGFWSPARSDDRPAPHAQGPRPRRTDR